MKARVVVTLKNGVLDPQGKAIEGALVSLGVNGVSGVRQGKVFDIEIGSGRCRGRARNPEGCVREAPRQHGDRELHHRHRLMQGRQAPFRCSLPSASHATRRWRRRRLVEADGFSLALSTTPSGRSRTAAPPSLLTLRCIASACSKGNVVTFVRDERP